MLHIQVFPHSSMPCRKTTFKRISRIIVPLIGIADGIFLVFVYSNRYWLAFIGYKQLIISLFVLIFSIAGFSLAFGVFVIAQHLIHFFTNIYNFISSIIFFLILTLLYFSSITSFDESQYWIQNYNTTFSSTKIVEDFNSDYPGDDSQGFIRQRTFIVHDVLLLTILIWMVYYVLFTFLSVPFLKFISAIKLFEEQEPTDISDPSNDYLDYENDEDETEMNDIEGAQDLNSKVKHVRSAAKLFNLVNIQDTDGSLQHRTMSNAKNDDAPNSPEKNDPNKPKVDVDFDASSPKQDNITNRNKPGHRKRIRIRKKPSGELPQPSFDNIDNSKTNDEVSISSSTPLNLSPLISHMTNNSSQSNHDNPVTTSNLDLESRNRPIIKSQASQTMRNRPHIRRPFMDPMPIRFHISSDSSSSYSYSSSTLFDSDDPLGLFADDTSDSW